MIRKTIFAAGVAMAAVIGAPAPASADIDITIHLGYGGFYGSNVSCRTGARIVDRRFNNVQIQSCAGSRYDYTGRRNGKKYWIKVSRATGRIVEVQRIK